MDNWINSNSSKSFIILSSRIKLLRNIEGYKFTNLLEEEEGRRLSKKVLSLLSNEIRDLKIINLWEDKSEADLYKEKFYITNSLINNWKFSSMGINKEETFNININEKEHIGLQCTVLGNNLKSAYDYLNEIDNFLEDNLKFSFREDFGYLTSTPYTLGTAMKASFIIHLPILSIEDKIENISKGLSRIGISIKGMYGERGRAYGNIYEISNDVTLGVKEKEIIEKLEEVALNLVNEEDKSRKKLLNKDFKNIEDRIFRSYGILKNARKLDWIEMVYLLSDLRLGVELELLDISNSILNKMMILTRDSLIKKEISNKWSLNDLNVLRSNMVREFLE